MDTGSQQLPTTYHQGYCYFDVNTGKFWIDVNDVPGSEKRMALNAYKSDWSSYAQTAESATSATHAITADSATTATNAQYDSESQDISTTYGKDISLVNGTTLQLINGNGSATGTGTLSIPYIIGNSIAAGVWTGTYPGITSYTDGLLILYKPNFEGATTTTLNINGIGAKNVYRSGTSKLTTHYPVNQPILLIYSASQNDGCWMCVDDYASDSNTIPSAFCTTSASSAAKTATCTYYTAKPNSYVHILFRYANTKQAALTLNINSVGAFPIYINNLPSSSTNYSIPAGTYIAFFDGSAYYIRTDDQIPANISGTAAYATTARTAEYDILNNPIATSFIRNVSGSSTAGAIDVTKTVYDTTNETYIQETSTIPIANNYTLPIASDTRLGGIKIGAGLSIDENGVLSVDFPAYDGSYS